MIDCPLDVMKKLVDGTLIKFTVARYNMIYWPCLGSRKQKVIHRCMRLCKCNGLLRIRFKNCFFFFVLKPVPSMKSEARNQIRLPTKPRTLLLMKLWPQCICVFPNVTFIISINCALFWCYRHTGNSSLLGVSQSVFIYITASSLNMGNH